VIESNAQTTNEYHCLVCQEKCMPNALKENAVKWWNPNWWMDSAVFAQVAAPRTKSLLLGIWQKPLCMLC